jgi:hypothetical protein
MVVSPGLKVISALAAWLLVGVWIIPELDLHFIWFLIGLLLVMIWGEEVLPTHLNQKLDVVLVASVAISFVILVRRVLLVLLT